MEIGILEIGLLKDDSKNDSNTDEGKYQGF